MKAPLRPHAQQERGAYIRVMRTNGLGIETEQTNPEDEYVPGPDYFMPTRSGRGIVVSYDDTLKGSRTISSRRVEEAVETMDYLKLCDEGGLACKRYQRADGKLGWAVGPYCVSDTGWYSSETEWKAGRTLREAYWRYKAAVTR